MTDSDFIIELFCRIDDQMKDVPKHSQAKMYPSELVPLGALFALKRGSYRAFYRWACHSFSHLFPNLLERTCFFTRIELLRAATGSRFGAILKYVWLM